MKDFIVVAHRGGKDIYEENTLEAFKNAINHGFSYVEMDIRMDKRKKDFYLEHDWIHAEKCKDNKLTKIVPLLPKGIKVFAEIKSNSIFSSTYARTFKPVFERYFDKKNTMIMSFNPFIVMRMKKLIPDVKTGFLIGRGKWFFGFGILVIARFNILFYKYILHYFFKPDVLLLHNSLINRNNIELAKKHGMQIFSFVTNKEKDVTRAKSFELDGIVSDNLDLIKLHHTNANDAIFAGK